MIVVTGSVQVCDHPEKLEYHFVGVFDNEEAKDQAIQLFEREHRTKRTFIREISGFDVNDPMRVKL